MNHKLAVTLAFAAIALFLAILAGGITSAYYAGKRSPRIVHVANTRPLIRDNTSTPAQVRANFAGKPAQVQEEGVGITCSYYGSPQSAINGDGPVWVIRLCTRGLSN